MGEPNWSAFGDFSSEFEKWVLRNRGAIQQGGENLVRAVQTQAGACGRTLQNNPEALNKPRFIAAILAALKRANVYSKAQFELVKKFLTSAGANAARAVLTAEVAYVVGFLIVLAALVYFHEEIGGAAMSALNAVTNGISTLFQLMGEALNSIMYLGMSKHRPPPAFPNIRMPLQNL